MFEMFISVLIICVFFGGQFVNKSSVVTTELQFRKRKNIYLIWAETRSRKLRPLSLMLKSLNWSIKKPPTSPNSENKTRIFKIFRVRNIQNTFQTRARIQASQIAVQTPKQFLRTP